MNNTYTEEFRRNAVAAVRSGFSATMLSRRLNVPRTSIENWFDHPKYKDIQPLMDGELPCLVPIKDEPPAAKASFESSPVLKDCLTAVFKTPNGVTLEFPQGLSMEQLKNLLLTFKEL